MDKTYTSNNNQRLILLFLLTSLFILNVLSVKNISLTYDEKGFYYYGARLLRLDTERNNLWDNSKMPFSVINNIPWEIARATKLTSFLDKSNSNKISKDELPVYMGRISTILFSLLLAFYVFRWTNELYGAMPAFFSLFIYMVSPNIIAHSGLVTVDLYAAGMITISLYYFWKFLNYGGWNRGLVSALTLGISQLAKYTCVYLYPIFLLIVTIRFLSNIFINNKTDYNYIVKHIKSFIWILFCFILVSIVLINIGFVFNKTFTPFGEYKFRSNLFTALQTKFSAISGLPVPLPYAYVDGLDYVKYLDDTGKTHASVYLFEKLKEPGKSFIGYYFIAFLFKEPIAIQIFILLAFVVYIFNIKKFNFLNNELLLFIPIILFAIYFNFFFKTQIGIRYYLVIFPLLYVFSGSLVRGWGEWELKQKAAIAILAIYLVASVISYYPHYISYFNELVFNRKMAFKILADSNIHWGQNKFYLEKYLDKHPNITVADISLTWEGDRSYYKAFVKRYPNIHLNPSIPISGRIVITTNDIAGIFDSEKYRWLRENFEPVDHIAYSYLVYEVSPEKLKRILH